MQKLSGHSQKRFIILITILFSWVFVGTLVNFHQEHVLGKHISTPIYCHLKSKDKDKTSDNGLSGMKNLPQNDVFGSPEAETNCEITECNFFEPLFSSFYLCHFNSSGTILRGPPMA